MEAPKIPDIDGQQPSDTMDIHARCQAGVMDLHAINVVRHNQGPPAVVDIPTVRQEIEISFDHACQPIRFGDAQTKAVLVEWAG